MCEILTFDELKEKIVSETNKNLLLGNGFSIAFNKSFIYKSLYKKAVKNDKDKIFTEDIKKLFNANGNDFEKVMDEMKRKGFDNDTINNIRETLIKILTSIHPKLPSDIAPNQYDRNYKFLSAYDNIYTTNYDLLLNWVITKKGIGSSFTEGFTEQNNQYLWSKLNANIFYLHGCLALFYEQKDNLIMKRFKDYENKMKIDHILKNMLNDMKFPLFVAEGSSQEKLTEIKRYNYLENAYENLSNMSGSLVTYGFGFNKNDNHIIDEIFNSQVKSVYIGLYDLNSIRALEKKLFQDNKYNKTIYFYDAKSVKIW